MADPRFIVIYPRPKNIAAFERVYTEKHVPLAAKKIAGKTKIVTTKIVGSPQGTPPYYRMVQVHFPSMAALKRSAGTAGTQEALAHAVKISTGGAPIFLIAEEQTFEF